MNFFKVKTSWSNLEFIPFKLCIASFYVIVGSYFHTFFDRYHMVVLILFAVSVVWTITLWIRKMRSAGKD